MSQSLAQNAIALLIDLAERGEINPWDVQVIDVIDRFLSDLKPDRPEGNRATYEADLSQSGQAFLYASMLVLLKADTLARTTESPEDQAEVLEAGLLDSDALDEAVLPLHLERQLRRRAVARPPQQRRVTLQELIEQLRLMSETMEETAPRVRPRRPRPHSRSQAVRTIAQLAHQENLTEVAQQLEQFLSTEWIQLSQGQEWLDFEALLSFWAQHYPNAGHAPRLEAGVASIGDRVGIFWALLLLASQSKVELSQSGFYQQLRIRHLPQETAYAMPE